MDLDTSETVKQQDIITILRKFYVTFPSLFDGFILIVRLRRNWLIDILNIKLNCRMLTEKLYVII